MIPFNKPYLTGKEAHYLYQAVNSGHISGNGVYTKQCQSFFEEYWGFKKALLTTSCTDALEMCALLLDIQPGDEVIMPSYTFVSTALAFVRQGAKIVFADSRQDNPGINEDSIENLITSKTKAIVPVHYAGVACNMDKIMAIANKHNLFIVEDAAQAIDSYFSSPSGLGAKNKNDLELVPNSLETGTESKNSPLGVGGENKRFTSEVNKAQRPLGSIGHLGCFSFHETKNIQCGEGGLLAINDEHFIKRAEILWEKGTNRAEFFRGEVNKYGWVDTGSSFLPNELTASFLYAQLENLGAIQLKRKQIWNRYYKGLKDIAEKGHIQLPLIPDYATNNAHMFYVICDCIENRSRLIDYLKSKNIHAVFHYLSLHLSPYYNNKHDGRELNNSERFEACLLRLPLYYELDEEQQDLIIKEICNFFA